MSSPAKRTACREEEKRRASPSSARVAVLISGPTPKISISAGQPGGRRAEAPGPRPAGPRGRGGGGVPPRRDQLLDDEPPAARRLQGHLHRRRRQRSQKPTKPEPVRRRDPTATQLSRHIVQGVEADLLPMDIEPDHD